MKEIEERLVKTILNAIQEYELYDGNEVKDVKVMHEGGGVTVHVDTLSKSDPVLSFEGWKLLVLKSIDSIFNAESRVAEVVLSAGVLGFDLVEAWKFIDDIRERLEKGEL